jgi:hypothetical protein
MKNEMKTPQVPAMPGTSPMGFTVTGQGVRVYQAMAVRQGIEFYHAHRMPINRAYTPKAMLATAAAITGKDYGKRWSVNAASNAIRDLSAWIEAQHSKES